VVGPLEQQPEVATQLAVVGGEHDVEIVAPAACGDCRQHAPDRFVDQFALHRVERRGLADLVGGERRRHPCRRRFVVADQATVVPRPEVARLGIEHGFAFGCILDVAGGQWHVAPVDATDLAGRRIPWVMRVGEAHPAEPVVVDR
jgi:hypothetical protein